MRVQCIGALLSHFKADAGGETKKSAFCCYGGTYVATSSKQGQPIPGIAHAVMLEV